MKQCLCILISLLFVNSTFAQKNEVYLNDDLLQISQIEFNKMNDIYTYYNLKFETDSLVVNVKVQRVKKGKISNEVLNSLKKELSERSHKKISDEDLIVINYYHGQDRCNSGGNKSILRTRYKRYLKRIEKIPNLSQFFVYKSSEGTSEYGQQLNWIEDKSGTIKNTFFPIHYPCGSFVIIDEMGNYYVRKGEYNIEEIIDLVKNKKTTFATTNSSY